MTSSVKRYGQFTARPPRTVGKFFITDVLSVRTPVRRRHRIRFGERKTTQKRKWIQNSREENFNNSKDSSDQTKLNHYSEKQKRMKRTRSNTKEMLSQGFEFRTAGIRGRASSDPARLRNS